jgi:AAA+ ATPase superfamily predicted ATPase
MRAKTVKRNKSFVGRIHELEKLSRISNRDEASIVVVYGRRRVGKTELLEQAFRKRNILKFEGIEGLSQPEQMAHVMWQFSEYSNNALLAKVKIRSWTEFFKLISDVVKKGIWTLYFEEVQWLADYKDKFISELKYFWDNHFRHNQKLILVLCGSSPSFMVNNVLHSKALYNRSLYEISLKEFSLAETRQLLKKRSNREIMDAYISVGGIPEYLKWINQETSVFLSLCKNSFTADSFFSHEYKRIFISSLARNKNYKKVIDFLSKRSFANRNQILKHLKLKSSGTSSALLLDLEVCGFIQKYTPFNLKKNSLLARYSISDAYLQFYFKFIKPIESNIDEGNFNSNPTLALNTDSHHKWLGFAFERMCRKNHRLFAKILGFESVRYKSGAFFNRRTEVEKPGYQVDLVYDRDDKVYTVCEIKYLQSKVTPKIIEEFEKKLALFPNLKNRTIHKVLITTEGADDPLTNYGYFDRVITLRNIFDAG